MKKYLSYGFTLVELLIVIALLGVIATIVIAAINPIEQANRARDAGMKADASQLISAIERYYTTHGQFPWEASSCDTNGGTACDFDAENEFPFITADDPSVGLCGAAGAACKSSSRQGELIASLELQTQFLNKGWIGATTEADKIFVGKGSTASGGVYACWVPKAKSNKQVLLNSALEGEVNKMFDAKAGFSSAGVPSAGDCDALDSAGWASANCVECVPE